MTYRIYTVLFWLLAINTAQSQITIVAEDLPTAGEQLVFYQDTLPDGVEVGPAGAGQSWDFSGLVADNSFSNKLFVPEDVSDSGQFPEADFVLQADSTYLFAQVTDSGLFNLGARVSNELLDTTFLVRYTPAQKVLDFPTTLGTAFDQTYSFRGAIDGSFFNNGIFDSLGLIRTIDERVEADAEGVVTTPAGSYDALRLKVANETVDSIFGQSFGVWIFLTALDAASTEYRWVAREGRGNVLSLFQDELGDVVKADWLQNITGNDVNAPRADFGLVGEEGFSVTFEDRSLNEPNAWLWDFGDGNTSNEQNPAHTYGSEGPFTVCLRAINDGGFDVYCEELTALVSSSLELEQRYNFRMFPNPVDRELRIDLELPPGERLFIEFSDYTGKVHSKVQLERNTTFSTGRWSRGFHVWSVYSSNGRIIGSGKIVKK